jgi:2-C-methyl-D-erythritol 4-phosphate cytidylyltransferase
MSAAARRFALIAAAGPSVRFGGGLPKQYAPIAGLPVLAHTIAALNRSVVLEAVFVVLPRGASVHRRDNVESLLHELEDEPVGRLLAVPLCDTLKLAEVGAGLRAGSTERTDGLWCAQTPQMFRYAILNHALRRADVTQILDEAEAVEALGVKPRLVQGSPSNIKVTYPEDIALAEAILAGRAGIA